MSLPEILAPAGDMTCLQTAIQAGADAVYLGLDAFNMRSLAAENFTAENLPQASAHCREHGVKLYLALNSIVFDAELAKVEEMIRFVKPYADAVIAGDWAVVRLCKKYGVPFHISTQMSCSNTEAALFLREQGARRVVLARECTLPEVARISRDAGIEVEVFVHGAQCVAESGRCLLSHVAYGCSSNRGECHQPCRREFLVREVDRFAENREKNPVPVVETIKRGDKGDAAFLVTPHRVFSAKDLCSLPFVDRLMKAGVASFKIEGRGRNPEYVKTVVGAYRKAVRAVAGGEFTPELAQTLVETCARVYHREFSCGLYYGRPGKDQFTDTDGNQATTKKGFVGIVVNYYARAKVVQVLVQDCTFAVGDLLQIHGPTTGVVELTAGELRHDAETRTLAEKGEWVTFPCESVVREQDKVYRILPVSTDCF